MSTAAPAPKQKKKAASAKGEVAWADPQSLMVRAMVLGHDRLAIAGPPDLGEKEADLLAFKNPDTALAGFEGNKGVFLRIIRTADGKKISECPLAEMPVFDGLSAAGGRLYLATRGGRLLCLGTK